MLLITYKLQITPATKKASALVSGEAKQALNNLAVTVTTPAEKKRKPKEVLISWHHLLKKKF
jgi:hypothetical protein